MSQRITIMQRSLSLSILLLLLIAARLAAQIPPLDDYGAGTKYVIAFPDTTTNILDPRYPNNRFKEAWRVFLYSSFAKNHVRIRYGGNNTTQDITLQAGRFQVQDIAVRPVVTRINSVESNTVTISSEYPIVVYCFAAALQGMEAWTPIPVDMWGTRYNAAMVPAESVADITTPTNKSVRSTRKPAPSEILVIAAYDSTVVTIAAKQRLEGLAGGRVVVTLNAGECYQVHSLADTSAIAPESYDLGGTVISSTRPVGVISGNTRALVQDQTAITGNACRNMLMEWLSPTEQLGTEFVFMPSWDSHRQGIGSPNERDAEYVRIYGAPDRDGTADNSFHSLKQGDTAKVAGTLLPDTLRQFQYAEPSAVYFKSSRPMQAMMHSTSILQFVSKTPCNNGVNCLTFEMWAPYMVEMTPREQWPSFAPYYAPDGPPAPMLHYINVVTDTLSMANIVDETGAAFPFTRKIPGTDLIWGSRAVAPGVDHYLYGKSGAKFSGLVYGFYKGSEQFRPAAYSEYEEYNALSYGYPLAPLRRVMAPGDSLVIDSTGSCPELSLTLRLVNPHPSGFRSIELDPSSVVNATLVPVAPQILTDLLGRTSVELKIVPLNPTKDAAAKLLVKDRTGKVWSVDYAYRARHLDVDPAGVDFGAISFDAFKDTVVTYTNPFDESVEIREVKLAKNPTGVSGADGFEVTATEPPGPAEQPARPILLKKGERFIVHLRLNTRAFSKLYDDSLKVMVGCTGSTIPVRGEAARWVIMVNDLNFGTFVVDPTGGSKKMMEMKVCNIGRGGISFQDAGNGVLDWLDASGLFSVPRNEIDALKGVELGPGECHMLHVAFDPAAIGHYEVTARFHANTRDRKDSSIWSAVVTTANGVAGESDPGHASVSIVPNAGAATMTIAYALGAQGRTTVTIHDGNGALVTTLFEGNQGVGEHRVEWDASGTAAGIYYCRISSGAWSVTRPLVVVR